MSMRICLKVVLTIVFPLSLDGRELQIAKLKSPKSEEKKRQKKSAVELDRDRKFVALEMIAEPSPERFCIVKLS